VYPRPAGDDAGRRALQAVTLGAELRERGIGLHVIEQGTGTGTMEGRAMFGMLGVLAERRRELIVANTMGGLATARARGRIAGQSGTGETHAGQRQMMPYGHELRGEGGHVARLASTDGAQTQSGAQKVGSVARPSVPPSVESQAGRTYGLV